MRRFVTVTGASVAAAFALAMGSVIPGLAYVSQGTSGASASPSSGPAGTQVTITATFKDTNGSGVAGSTVVFSQQSGPTGCVASFSSTTGTTNSSGTATTTVTLPANCPGQFVFAGSTQGVTVTTSVSEVAAATTSSAPSLPAAGATVPSPGPPVLLMVIGAFGLLLAAAGALELARRRA